MDTNQIGALGYAVSTIVFVLLTILLLSGWRRRNQSLLPALATGLSVVWAGVWAASYFDLTRAPALLILVEWSRGLAWLFATIAILREIADFPRLRSSYAVRVVVLAGAPVAYFLLTAKLAPYIMLWVTGGYVAALMTVLAVEHMYRIVPSSSRSGIPYICIALAGIFLFDLAIYVFVLAGVSIGPEFYGARGFVNVVFCIPLVLGMWRRAQTSQQAQVPRQVAFYLFGFTIIATYVALVIIGYQYVRNYGGQWSAVAGIVLVVAAISVAAVLFASGHTRARVRVLLTKTFLQYKYDYRKEWLRFISTLSRSGLEDVGTTAVRAVAQIVDSPGGVVWIQEDASDPYSPAGSWNSAIPNIPPIADKTALVTFLRDRKWVVDLEELKSYPERYDNLQLHDWLSGDDDWWLIVPIFMGSRLYGFIILKKPRIVPTLNFEDHDLLRTVGSHVGMHINQAESDKRLAESRQFGAYNRLTAFLMHDLNNLIAQQSLVVRNAEKFRDNPKFIDDAIDTIAHSVARMKRLMEQLSSGSKVPASRLTDVNEAIGNAVSRCKPLRPTPDIEISSEPMLTRADPERLTTVFEHLIRNAQQATPEDGEITIKAKASNGAIHVSIADTGAGMSQEFIRERLFRPFDSTKGSQSMGIGAYQARDYVRALGGQMEVSSSVGAGTRFSIRLPAGD
ncbi:MAG: PEP-CTERM system histidine kinase PrsK [Woeseia sp.]|nr:PEP-CTERM system histidine kinase PrsK [Woeseia sp.]NNE61976.1 PEP-CTERM system histidine kinase PrsK [Woeseia sp.]